MNKRMYSRICHIRDSSVISDLSYDFENKRLRITFNSGSIWRYEGVYPSDFQKLCGAQSPGKAFNELIRDRYDAYRELPAPHKQLSPKKRTEGYR